jgi:activator of Hsp90 ATPase-like protein
VASMSLTANGDAIVSEIYIAAPAQRIFQALVEPQRVLQWWGQSGIYRCTEFEADLKPGGKWRSSGEAAIAVSSPSQASISKSMLRAYWLTPGSRAGPAMSRLPFDGNSSPSRTER